MGWKEMARQRAGSVGGVGAMDDGELCVGGGRPDSGKLRCSLYILSGYPSTLYISVASLLSKKPQGRGLAVGIPLLRGKRCFKVPRGRESWGGGANPDMMAEAVAGGRA